MFRMNIETMNNAIAKGTWEIGGKKLVAKGENFYKSLFRKESQESLKKEDVCEMFASFIEWKTTMDNLTGECLVKNTREDRKAVEYAQETESDIRVHMHKIITTVPWEDNQLHEDIAKLGEEEMES